MRALSAIQVAVAALAHGFYRLTVGNGWRRPDHAELGRLRARLYALGVDPDGEQS